MYPSPFSFFLMSSSESEPSSLASSFSRTCVTNSSTDEYPARSAYRFTRASNALSSLMPDPNIFAPQFTRIAPRRSEMRPPSMRLGSFRKAVDAELGQQRRRQVLQRRRGPLERAARQQHARDRFVIHAVVAAPRARIVHDHVRRHGAKRRFVGPDRKSVG